jgi:hypothetical protein
MFVKYSKWTYNIPAFSIPKFSIQGSPKYIRNVFSENMCTMRQLWSKLVFIRSKKCCSQKRPSLDRVLPVRETSFVSRTDLRACRFGRLEKGLPEAVLTQK